MNGICIHIIFLIVSMLRIEGYVLRQVTLDLETGSPNPDASDESTNLINFPEKVEKLMSLLRKHQHDEEELKVQIRRLLTGFRIPQNRDTSPSFMKICNCKHRSVKDVLNMLNLSPNQNELLGKIVSMMQGRSCRHTSDKRKANIIHDGGTNVYTTATEKINVNAPLKENLANKRYGEEIELNLNQLENIAYEVVNIIKRTPHLQNQLYPNDFGKITLPGGDAPPSEPTSENA